MYKKGRILIPVVVLALLAAILFLRRDSIFGGGAHASDKDSMAVVEQLTPQIASLSLEIKKAPEDAGLYFARANAYYDYGNLKYALSDYTKAYQLDSLVPAHVLGLSDCLLELNNADGAIGLLIEYLRHDPDNIDINMNLGMDYFLLPEPKYTLALESFNKVLKQDLHNADAYFYKGLVFRETGDTTSAISSFQTTIETDPDYYDAYMQLGLIMAARHNKLALTYYDNAISLCDTCGEAHYAKAKYLQDNGKVRDAINNYKQLIIKSPQDADAIYNLATLYYGIDSIEQAYRFFDLTIKQSPARAMAYYGKGVCAEELKKTDEAISLYTQALNLDPELKEAEEKLQKLTNK
ncbi:MAG: tetratricopeptide repeat protein [Chitinophagales bacterium]